MTLAPWAITKPARSDVSVTGTYGWNAPENNADVNATTPAVTMTKIRVHQPGCMPSERVSDIASYPDRWKFPDCP